MIENLRILVLDNPFASWDSPFVRDMFNKIILLKKLGYQSRFPLNYAPVDKSDFHGTHLAFCQERNGELFPITAYRVMERDRCEKYGMAFSGEVLCDTTSSEEHKLALREFCHKYKEVNIAYSSSFTIDPNIQREYRKEAIDFLIPLFAYSHIHWKIEKSLALGSVRTHTDTMYHQMGLLPLKHNGETLNPIAFPCYAGEEFEVQACEELTPHCLEMAKKYLYLWKGRIQISDASVGHDTVENYLVSTSSLTKMSA